MESHAVIVHLRLSDTGFGTDEDRIAILKLEEMIEDAVAATAAGDLDGDEFGQGECVLYVYGPDADRLFALIEPLLKSSPVACGGFAVKQYGGIDELDLRTERVMW